MLHDVGIAGTLLALSDTKGKRKTPPDLISIWPAVDRVHQRAGELMAKHWELPADIGFAISAHHQVMIAGHAHPLAATVSVVSALLLAWVPLNLGLILAAFLAMAAGAIAETRLSKGSK